MTHLTTTQSLSMQKCVFAMLTLLLLTSTTGCAFGRATLGDTINLEEVTNLTKE
ncbi:MAG: hypothetical protein MRJ68_04300 [Nitrospira sp.]|nr:hypothetical protein [Nitrospira sp.]